MISTRNPLKVMNILVHGDTRSHVVLSPPYITAGSNLVMECVMIALNQIYEDHHVMPRVLNVQLDNANVNKSALTMGFAGLLVFLGVLEVVCKYQDCAFCLVTCAFCVDAPLLFTFTIL